MGILVSKFGGSSMADAQMFAKVRDIIASRNLRQYIVLSAPGKRNICDHKITDLLCLAHERYVRGEDGDAPLLEVKKRFTKIIEELHLNIDPNTFLCTLDDSVHRSPDLAASRGEYLCAKLFAAYSGLPFVDAAELIHFDSNGRIQPSEIRRSVSAMIKRYPSAVIPGFYGSLPDGRIKTFTRGGSDITGALIAAAADADLYENWTDVDGLMSIDPAITSEAICHPAVSYRQMRILARAGARILHPYCVEPVCEAGIPTVLKNTFFPEKPGTYISDHVRGQVPCICAQEGLCAQYIDQLDILSQKIAEGLASEKYADKDGRELITLKSKEISGFFPVAIVSAYGLSESICEKASSRIQSIAESKTEHGLKLLVRPESVHNIQCELHSLLLTASRTRADCAGSFHPSR